MKICPNKCAQSFSDFTLAGQSPLVALSRLQRFQEVSKVMLNKMCQKQIYIYIYIQYIHISTNNKYMDTCHRYNQTSKQREEHQEYQLDPRYLSSLSNLKPSVKCHAPQSHSSPGIFRLWWVLVNHLPIHSKGRITLAEFENCARGKSSTYQILISKRFYTFLSWKFKVTRPQSSATPQEIRPYQGTSNRWFPLIRPY